MKYIQILLVFLISGQFSSQSLKGIIKDSISDKQTLFRLKLTNNVNGKEYFSYTHQDGAYQFDDVSNGNYILSLVNDSYSENNQFNVHINGETTADFYVSKYCRFKENKSGVCPVCHSKENVLPVFYGLTTWKFMKKNKKKYHFAGCDVSACSPKWYCKKDQLEF